MFRRHRHVDESRPKCLLPFFIPNSKNTYIVFASIKYKIHHLFLVLNETIELKKHF